MRAVAEDAGDDVPGDDAGALAGAVEAVGVGDDGVTDGCGFGPFFKAAATAEFQAESVGWIDLPLTRIVGVPVTPAFDALSVIAATSAACFSLSTHCENVVNCCPDMPMCWA